MLTVVRRTDWQELCNLMRSCGMRDRMKECRNITQINGCWYLDGCEVEEWLYFQLFPKNKFMADPNEIQRYPVGPTAR